VQECLGHASLASVMIYLHITSHGKEDSRRRLNQLMRGVLS
jgi:site-specific recombinase XerD